MNSFLPDAKRLMSFLLGHLHWVIFGRVYTSALALLLSVVLSRSMPIEGYGQYQFYISAFSLAAVFSLTSSTNTLLKYAAIGYECSYRIIFKFRLRFSFLGSTALILWGLLVSSGDDVWVFVGLAVLLPIFNSCDLFEYLYQARIQFKSLNSIYIIRSTFTVVAPIVTFMVSRDVILTLFAYLGCFSLVNLIFHIHSLKDLKSEIIPDSELTKKIKLESLFLSLAGIASLACLHLDRVLIYNQMDAKSLAIYANGMILGLSINALFKTVLGTINGRLAFVEIKHWHYYGVLTFGTILGFLGVVCMPLFIWVLFGEKFSDSVVFGQIVLGSLGVYLVSNLLFDNVMFGKENNIKAIYINNLVVSLGQFLSLLGVFHIFSDSKYLLIMFALQYPWKAFLNIAVLLLSKRILNID
jgi:O-antigen/teichoic acid export membrane protein